MRPNSLLLVLFLGISQSRQDALEVKINTKDDFCLVVPKDYQTSIGDSEKPGGETVWCQNRSRATSSSTGIFSGPFWRAVDITTPKSGVIQMTGCIDVSTCDR